MRRARADDATTVVTIFVNPRQFGDPGDLELYPRSEARDLAICEEEGADLVWAPPVEEVYPPGFDTTVTVGDIAHPLEGAARPGHCDGVATVVSILFALVGAEHAYFGQKDAQQVMVIRRMARDLALPTAVIACPTVRESDGLALSSRNVHLTPAERAAAPVLHQALMAARDAHAAGERSADALRRLMRTIIDGEPLAAIDYVSVADGTSLAELERVDAPALLSLAVRFGGTRLIDNEPIGD
jgi:pantoate--beta-alanine ligase